MNPLVYIAGPYTSDPISGTRAAIDVWNELRESGVTAIVPHVSLLLDMVYPQGVSYWYSYDLEIMRHCDVVLRIPGKSAGADREVAEAIARGIPVFHSTRALCGWVEGRRMQTRYVN